MAFNINAHVILNGPKNIKAVTKRIRKDLGRVNARINLVVPKNLSKQIGSFNKGLDRLTKNIKTLSSSATAANSHLQKLGNQLRTLSKVSTQLSKSQTSVQKSLAKTGQNVNEARNEIQAFGKDAALAIRRFAAFTVATGVVFGFVRAIQSATKAAIDYEREIVKIVQVTGASARSIKGLSNTIQELSVSLGVDANELAELGRIFAQTGQTIDQVGDSIRAIARSSLAPSFGEMKNTAEGLIAAMAQFNIAANRSEEVLAGLNAVSKKFAVESEDMISVIRRAGGVFAATAGQMDDPVASLNELIGIFTAVRSTTRETADTIAVGLRTIFTRIQRRGTIEFLKQFNIELVNTQGNFIGLFPAFQALSKGLDDIIRRGDALTLSAITEELGGVRQVGKLIPAITQFNKALAATKIAGEAAAAGMGPDVALALKPLGKQFELLQQRFNALIRDITQSKTFQNMAKVALSMANAFLSVAETLKPLIPLLTTFAAIKISKGLSDFGIGFIGGLRRGGGAAGAGGALGGVVTGGGSGKPSGSAAGNMSAQQALTTAIKSHSTLLTSNNTALRQLGIQVASNTTAITTTGGNVATVSTQIIGAVGNLINALQRASLGAVGGVSAQQALTTAITTAMSSQSRLLTSNNTALTQLGTQVRGNTAAINAAGGKVATSNIQMLGAMGSLTNALNRGALDKGRATKSISAQQALTTAMKSYSTLLATNNTALKQLGIQVIGNTTAINTTSGKVATSSIQLIGAMGNLINALRRAALGGGGVVSSRYKPPKFARGGYVSGPSHAQGGVHAELEGGEYVIPKTQYHAGGTTGSLGVTGMSTKEILESARTQGKFKGAKDKGEKGFATASKDNPVRFSVQPGRIGGFFLEEHEGNDPRPFSFKDKPFKLTGKLAQATGQGSELPAVLQSGKLSGFFPSKTDVKRSLYDVVKAQARQSLSSAVKRVAKEVRSKKIVDIPPINGNEELIASHAGSRLASDNNAVNTMTGFLNEGVIQALTGAVLSGGGSNFDFPNASIRGNKKRLGALFGASSSIASLAKADAKASWGLRDTIPNKIINDINAGNLAGVLMHKTKKRSSGSTDRARLAKGRSGSLLAAAGGSIFAPQGTDTVPAMLTPGEFVINKKSAQSFGYGNLKKINRYAKGGVAATGNVQYLKNGTDTTVPSGRESGRGDPLSMVFGIQMAVGALAGFTAALSAFDLQAPLASFGALGMAALQAGMAFSLLAPGMSKTIMANTTLVAGLKSVKGQFKNVIEPFKEAGKAAKVSFGSARAGIPTDYGRGFVVKPASVAKSLSAGSGKFFSSMGRSLPRLLKGVFTGIPGLITALLVAPISNAIADLALGKKEEIAPGVRGRRGVTAGQATGAGAGVGGATGAVTGAAIGSMILPVWGTLVGAVAGALIGGMRGAMIEAKAQAEFIAFEKLEKSSEKLSESFDKLARFQGKISVEGLKSFTRNLKGQRTATEGAFKAGVTRREGALPGFMTKKGKSTAIAAALQVAASQIGPEVFANMSANLERFLTQATSRMATMGETAFLRSLANIETVSFDSSDADSADLINNSFKRLIGTLDEAAAGGNEFAAQLKKTIDETTRLQLLGDVGDKLKELNEAGKTNAFNDLTKVFNMLTKEVDLGTASFDEIDKAIAQIGYDTRTSTKELENLIVARRAEANEMGHSQGVMQLAGLAAKNTNGALDALAAGLTRFGDRINGVVNQTTRLSSQMENAFSQITGARTIGQLDQFNPFKNLAAATDEQIDASISHLKTFGKTADSETAFGGLGDMLKAGKDFPMAMRDLTEDLRGKTGPSGKVENQAVLEAIESKFGGNLPDPLLKGLKQILFNPQGRQDTGAFAIDTLVAELTEGGNISEFLTKGFQQLQKRLGDSDDALRNFRNSLLKVAKLHEEMAKHRLQAELAMLDKSTSIRDRINSALQKTPDVMKQAIAELKNRISVLVKGGVVGGIPTPGNVLNPDVLFTRLESLEQNRTTLRSDIGLAEGEDMQAVFGDTAEWTKKMQENSVKLGLVNSQINGTVAALKELAHDTRVLAAIESKIAEQQSKSAESKSTVMTLLEGVDKLRKGEIKRADFKKQFSDPMSSIEKVFAKDGPPLDFSEGFDLLKRMEAGDPLVSGLIGEKFDQLVAQEQTKPEVDRKSRADLVKDFTKDLLTKTAGTGAGIIEGEGGPQIAAAIERMLLRSFKADDEAEALGREMAKVGNDQVNILQTLMEFEQKQMSAVLEKADAGFLKAAIMFQDAVAEFALFRGGVTDVELTDLQAELAKLTEARKDARERVLAAGGTVRVEGEEPKVDSEAATKLEQKVTKAGQTAFDDKKKELADSELGDDDKMKLQEKARKTAEDAEKQLQQRELRSARESLTRADIKVQSKSRLVGKAESANKESNRIAKEEEKAAKDKANQDREKVNREKRDEALKLEKAELEGLSEPELHALAKKEGVRVTTAPPKTAREMERFDTDFLAPQPRKAPAQLIDEILERRRQDERRGADPEGDISMTAPATAHTAAQAVAVTDTSVPPQVARQAAYATVASSSNMKEMSGDITDLKRKGAITARSTTGILQHGTQIGSLETHDNTAISVLQAILATLNRCCPTTTRPEEVSRDDTSFFSLIVNALKSVIDPLSKTLSISTEKKDGKQFGLDKIEGLFRTKDKDIRFEGFHDAADEIEKKLGKGLDVGDDVKKLGEAMAMVGKEIGMEGDWPKKLDEILGRHEVAKVPADVAPELKEGDLERVLELAEGGGVREVRETGLRVDEPEEGDGAGKAAAIKAEVDRMEEFQKAKAQGRADQWAGKGIGEQQRLAMEQGERASRLPHGADIRPDDAQGALRSGREFANAVGPTLSTKDAKQTFEELKRKRRGRLGKSEAERLEGLSPDEKKRRLRSLGEDPRAVDQREEDTERLGPRSSLELDVDKDTILLDKLEKEMETPETDDDGKITKELTRTQKKNNAKRQKTIDRIRKRRDTRAANLKALTGEEPRTMAELEEADVGTIEKLEAEGQGFTATAPERRQENRTAHRLKEAENRDEAAWRKQLEKEGMIEPGEDPGDTEFDEGLRRRDFKHHENKLKEELSTESRQRDDNEERKKQRDADQAASKLYNQRIAGARKKGKRFTPQELQNEKFIENIKGMSEEEWTDFSEGGFEQDLTGPSPAVENILTQFEAEDDVTTDTGGYKHSQAAGAAHKAGLTDKVVGNLENDLAELQRGDQERRDESTQAHIDAVTKLEEDEARRQGEKAVQKFRRDQKALPEEERVESQPLQQFRRDQKRLPKSQQLKDEALTKKEDELRRQGEKELERKELDIRGAKEDSVLHPTRGTATPTLVDEWNIPFDYGTGPDPYTKGKDAETEEWAEAGRARSEMQARQAASDALVLQGEGGLDLLRRGAPTPRVGTGARISQIAAPPDSLPSTVPREKKSRIGPPEVDLRVDPADLEEPEKPEKPFGGRDLPALAGVNEAIAAAQEAAAQDPAKVAAEQATEQLINSPLGKWVSDLIKPLMENPEAFTPQEIPRPARADDLRPFPLVPLPSRSRKYGPKKPNISDVDKFPGPPLPELDRPVWRDAVVGGIDVEGVDPAAQEANARILTEEEHPPLSLLPDISTYEDAQPPSSDYGHFPALPGETGYRSPAKPREDLKRPPPHVDTSSDRARRPGDTDISEEEGQALLEKAQAAGKMVRDRKKELGIPPLEAPVPPRTDVGAPVQKWYGQAGVPGTPVPESAGTLGPMMGLPSYALPPLGLPGGRPWGEKPALDLLDPQRPQPVGENGKFSATGGGAVGGQVEVVELEGGEEAATTIQTAVATGAEEGGKLAAQHIREAYDNTNVNLEGRVNGQIVVVLKAPNGGLNANIDIAQIEQIVSNALNENINSTDGSSKGDMGPRGMTNPASNRLANGSIMVG